MNLAIQSAVTMSSLDFLNDIINPARLSFGESSLRNGELIRKIISECDDLPPVTDYLQPERGGTAQAYYMLNFDQMMLVGMRESKAVRRSVLEKLKQLESKPISIPQTYAEALRLAADQAEQLALMAPKAKFVDSYVEASGSFGFREAAKILGVKENEFRKFLIDHDIYYYLAGKPTAYAHHIDAGRFTIKTGENEANGHAFSQTKFTPKGIEWVAGLMASEKAKAALNEVV